MITEKLGLKTPSSIYMSFTSTQKTQLGPWVVNKQAMQDTALRTSKAITAEPPLDTVNILNTS